MPNYIDGFVFPLREKHLLTYQEIAQQVARVWLDHGALDYQEFLGDDLHLEGTRSFIETTPLEEGECLIFGWVSFPSKEVRNKANAAVSQDPRMNELVGPLMNPEDLIFDARRMVYGGFVGF